MTTLFFTSEVAEDAEKNTSRLTGVEPIPVMRVEKSKKDGMWIEPDPELTGVVIASAIEVHRYFGPGLLESVYESALFLELQQRSIHSKRQAPVPALYKGVDLGTGFRADLIVENSLLLEIKTVDTIHSVHLAQALSYMKALRFRRGLILNFNAPQLRLGIKRVSLVPS